MIRSRMPRGRNQMPYYGQCPENEIPHMQRGPCFPDNYGKMDGPCGMNVGEFKSPMMNVDSQPPPSKKKRRASNAMASNAQSSVGPPIQDLLPPPLTGYGDTIVASNPFDDAPPTPSMSHMNAMNHVNKHMGVGPCMSPAAPMMGSMSPCHIVGSPMGCGPSVGSPINCGPPMGRCSPMGGGGNNANCGPGNSPHTSCNSRQVSRSPLVCTPMSTSSVMNNSPMNVNSGLPMNRSPSSLGSPLGSVMASNVRGNSPLDCGLGINSVGSQKGSPMSVMNSHSMNNMNCGSPMGSPSNVSMNNCNSSNMMGSPITSPLNNVPCSLSGGSDLGINLNGVMNRSPMSGPPNSVNASIMCNSSMKGPSPINTGQLNSQMSMNCNTNAPMVNMGGKPDMNMSELGLRDNCGPPGHMSMKSSNGPLSGACGMPVSNVNCTRQSDISSMQCGPMNSPHCNTMMNNSCGPPMNHGVPCIGNGINRQQCGPNMGMGMGNPYDGMTPQQCRPNMNRSQFSRGMGNVPYGPLGSMNGPMSGPMNGPLNTPINGPSMNSLCAPAEMGNMSCTPNSNANGMHCIGDSPMNNSQCMNNMNQCSAPNSMFGSQYNPFDVSSSRCSPNLHFNSNEMNVNNNFYRSNVSNAPSSSCVSNMHPSVVTGGAVTVCTSSNDVLSVTDSIMSTGVVKNDSSTVDSDIASVVCGITGDNADDLNLIGDNLLRESKAEEQRNKPMKDFNNRMLLNDETGDLKDDPLDGKSTKVDLVDGKMGDDLKLEGKRDGEPEKSESTSTLDSTTTTTTNTASSTTTTCSSTVSTTTTSITTSVTASSVENGSTSEDGESGSAACNVSSKSNENNDNEDEYMFKGSNSETHSNSSAHSNTAPDNGENGRDEGASEDKIKEEPEEKLLENTFNEEEDKLRDDKSDSSNDVKPPEEAGNEKEGKANAIVKIENDDFYDNNMKNKNDCPGGNGLRGNGNGFNGGGMLPGPPNNFSMPNANDVPNMMNNSSMGMNDSLCGSPMLGNMNRSPMPNAMNHSMSFTNRPIGKMPPLHRSKSMNTPNPNAPVTYTCGHCHKDVNDNDQAVLCESGCHFWYHRTCSGLTETAYQLLTSEVYAEWACDRCLSTKSIPLVKYKP